MRTHDEVLSRAASVAASATLTAMVMAALCIYFLPIGGKAPVRGESLRVFDLATASRLPPAPVHARPSLDQSAPAPPPQTDGGTAAPLPSPPAAPPASAGDGAAVEPAVAIGPVRSDYQDRVRAHVIRFIYYPVVAVGGRLRGTVRVGVELSREGRVLSAWIEESSGYGALDDAAILTLRRAEPMPPIPQALPGELTLSFPLEFLPPRIGPVIRGAAEQIEFGPSEPETPRLTSLFPQ